MGEGVAGLDDDTLQLFLEHVNEHERPVAEVGLGRLRIWPGICQWGPFSAGTNDTVWAGKKRQCQASCDAVYPTSMYKTELSMTFVSRGWTE
jgi:hypothetical protein